MLNAEEILITSLKEGLVRGVKDSFDRYNSPLQKLYEQALTNQQAGLQQLLQESISSCVNDETFKEEIRAATRQTLAKLLVQRFGGELEKQVNALKSNPVTRAQITMSLDKIVAENLVGAG